MQRAVSRTLRSQHVRQRAGRRIGGLALAVTQEQLDRTPGQHPADFTPLPFSAGNDHVIVPGRLVAHPRNRRCLRPLFDWDALGPCDRAAADGNGVIRNQSCHQFPGISLARMKIEKIQDRRTEILCIHFLLDRAVPASGIELALVRWVLALDLKFLLQRRDAHGRRPDTARESLPAFHFNYGPTRAILLDAPAEGSIAGWQQTPLRGYLEHATIGSQDVAGLGKSSDFTGFSRHDGEANRPPAKLKPGTTTEPTESHTGAPF